VVVAGDGYGEGSERGGRKPKERERESEEGSTYPQALQMGEVSVSYDMKEKERSIE